MVQFHIFTQDKAFPQLLMKLINNYIPLFLQNHWGTCVTVLEYVIIPDNCKKEALFSKFI